MPERKLVVSTPEGVHARPAAEVAHIASQTTAPVTIQNTDGVTANAKSIVALLTLNIANGQEITIRVGDTDHTDVLDRLTGVLRPTSSPTQAV